MFNVIVYGTGQSKHMPLGSVHTVDEATAQTLITGGFATMEKSEKKKVEPEKKVIAKKKEKVITTPNKTK